MLHMMLRMGLRDDLKYISGHKYDSIKDFNKLRQLENDYKNPTKPITAKAAIDSSDQDELLELKRMIKQLTTTWKTSAEI